MTLFFNGAIAGLWDKRAKRCCPRLPQPFPTQRGWEITLYAKGIERASACARMCVSSARLILLPICLTAPRLITRRSALYNLIS